MLGVASVVEELPGLSEEITNVADHGDGETVDLDKLNADCRARLNRINQATKHNVHLVVTVLSGSLLGEQVENFREYNVAASQSAPRVIGKPTECMYALGFRCVLPARR
jgi:hypothetical protein